jgi:hypothetical protein
MTLDRTQRPDNADSAALQDLLFREALDDETRRRADRSEAPFSEWEFAGFLRLAIEHAPARSTAIPGGGGMGRVGDSLWSRIDRETADAVCLDVIATMQQREQDGLFWLLLAIANMQQAAAGAEPVSADEFREFCRNALVQREILSRLPTEAMN